MKAAAFRKSRLPMQSILTGLPIQTMNWAKSCPPLNMVYRLANAFHVDYTQILEGDSGRTAPLGDGGTLLQQYPRSTYELTAREQQLVLHYRMMTAEDQQRAL